jgi:hypothetical protein
MSAAAAGCVRTSLLRAGNDCCFSEIWAPYLAANLATFAARWASLAAAYLSTDVNPSTWTDTPSLVVLESAVCILLLLESDT